MRRLLLFIVLACCCHAAEPRSVDRHGLLKIQQGRLCSAAGKPVQLKGMSLFWSQWSPAWYDAKVIDNLVDQWGCTLVRVAMGVEMGGYLTNPAAEKARVRAVVDAAIARGIYVIIDWHDHKAEQHQAEAVAFFTEMAQAYRNSPQVLWEIYNEPLQIPWPTVKTYAEAVIAAIRGTGAQQVVIVGTPTWSQDVHKAADDPLKGSNIAYTLHFYAGTHKESLRKQALYALKKGQAIVVTEWGTCDASGNGGFDETESAKWLAFCDEHGLSWANWSLFDKPESASAFKPGTKPAGPWSPADLTPSGALVVPRIADRARDWLRQGSH